VGRQAGDARIQRRNGQFLSEQRFAKIKGASAAVRPLLFPPPIFLKVL